MLFSRTKIYSEGDMLKAFGYTNEYAEAAFQASSVPNVMKNIASLIGKRLGQPLVGGKFAVIVKKPTGTFTTYKYIIGNGQKAIRFNFKGNGTSSSIDNIDFYNSLAAYPQMNLDVHGINVVQLLDFIVKVIQKGKPGMTAEVSNEKMAVNEAVELEGIYDEAARGDYESALSPWLKANKITPQKMADSRISHLRKDYIGWSAKNNMEPIGEGPFWKTVKEMIASSGAQNKYSKTVTVKKVSGREAPVMSAQTKSKEEELDKSITGRISVKEKFDQIKEYTKLVVKGVKPGMILTGDGGLGKAQPLYSKVLTTEGFKPMGEIGIDDLIVTPDGRSTTISNIIPNQEKNVYRIEFSDGRFVDAAEDHLWKVYVKAWQRKKIKGKTYYIHDGYRIITTKELQKNIKVPTYKDQTYIPLAFPEQRQDVELPIDPYILGALIGDGCLVGKGTIGFCSADQQIIDEIKSRLPDDMQINKQKSNKYGYFISPTKQYVENFNRNFGGKRTLNQTVSPMVVEFKKMNLMGKKSPDKFIPQIYKTASFQQKLDLINGLFDTDGSINPKPGNASFCTTSLQLAEDVRDILWSIGALVNIKEKKPFFKDKSGNKKFGKKAYVLKIRYRKTAELFKLERKKSRAPDNYQYEDLKLRVVSVKELGVMPVQCISINGEDNLYLTDNYIVTHNSFSIQKVLSDAGADYEVFKGHIASAVNLYQLLYEHNQPGKIVVLDDNDEILSDAAAVNILKGALESGEGAREISYKSQRMPKDEDGERLPTKFEYVGKMFFISNKYLRDLPGPLKSRAFKVELDLTPEEIVQRISEIAYDIDDLKGVPKPIIKECIKFMEKVAPAIGKFDIRSFTDVVANRMTGHKSWQAWAYASIKSSYGLS